jgi:Sec-independent protein secretion pathway component TatC
MASKPSAIKGARIVGERYVRLKRQENPDGRMPLMDHLRELRNRLLKALIAIAIGMIIALVFSDQSWTLLTRPVLRVAHTRPVGLQNDRRHARRPGVFDPFFLRIKIAFYEALIVTSPGLVLPAVGVHCAGPVLPREEVGLHLRL